MAPALLRHVLAWLSEHETSGTLALQVETLNDTAASLYLPLSLQSAKGFDGEDLVRKDYLAEGRDFFHMGRGVTPL